MTTVTLLYNKSNLFGISRDVDAITKSLGGAGYMLRKSDPLEPPVATDIAIHLEVPVYVWMPWAAKNILVVNPEWFEAAAWAPYMSRFDAVIFKDRDAADEAVRAGWVGRDQVVVVPWGAAPPAAAPVSNKRGAPKGTVDTGFVWFLGGSKNKRAAVRPIVEQWKAEYPPLRIYSTESLAADLSGVELPETVKVEVRDLDAGTRNTLAAFFRGHICCSRAEGFGYTAAEAEWHGAFTILNDLPVYRQDYGGRGLQEGVAFVPLAADAGGAAGAGPGCMWLPDAIAAFEALGQDPAALDALASRRKETAEIRWTRFQQLFKDAVDRVGRAKPAAALPKHLPPVLQPADCPPISVVTLLHNRRKFFDLACHSLMVQDYPKDKIEWIIVEDSDDPQEDASDRVMAVAAAAAPVRVEYIPLRKKTAIGKKRNLGVEKATADIILMMDDDDHYPETSFRRRVAWLTRHSWAPGAVAATTIACYDLVKGISAVNVPPLGLPLGQRVSEATLTFKKDWWRERGFPADVQIGEGEGVVDGRAETVLEIPPQQVIVAFSHGKNASSRRIPASEGQKPGCFWGFPPEFLQFIHGLAGVTVVEEKGTGSGQKKRS